jgi:hypothetical protein
MPTFIWCCGPGCNSGQMHEGGLDQPIVRCNACKFRSCFRHRGAWHETLTCEEFDTKQQDPNNFKSTLQRTGEDAEIAAELVEEERQRVQRIIEKASVQMVQLTTKKCPGQGCNWRIEKNKGCAHMTCKPNLSSKSSPFINAFQNPLRMGRNCLIKTGIKCRHEFCWVCMKTWRSGHICRC